MVAASLIAVSVGITESDPTTIRRSKIFFPSFTVLEAKTPQNRRYYGAFEELFIFFVYRNGVTLLSL
ncbi:hypothetical protein AN964_11735 [Heyndrickxia shackletonii]|uniref:Uncharacterized protein n=1 Tax=Heyndrickxia shackletonii TaxID=157838 RepID=A0A0Q3WZ90_9BACI|nr:hypothetical protein AN964_11735 [Heyndrickxia shackletonii]